MRRSAYMLLFLLTLITVTPAGAEVTIYEFAGTVTTVFQSGAPGLGSLAISSGDTLHGSFIVDRSIGDIDGAPHRGVYPHAQHAPLSVRVGPHTITIDRYDATVTDDWTSGAGHGPFDLFELENLTTGRINGIPALLTGDLDFTNAPQGTFSGDALPTIAVLSHWPGHIALFLYDPITLDRFSALIHEVHGHAGPTRTLEVSWGRLKQSYR